MTTQQEQEYEVAFVTALPQGVPVVDAHTLDFSKNPAGSLAFRYKHGWILINPLIPSRGLSGGGLARQHGHKSGGFTTGHFHKGADGKIHFKAHTNYGDKSEWEKSVKNAAAGVSVKQDAAKAAVQHAEDATNHAAKLAEEKAPKAAQAAAHAAASAAHQDAVKKFQALGENGLKSGVMTHSAHSAIHAEKAQKLEIAAKAEKAQKLVQRKDFAAKLSTKATGLSDAAKADDSGSMLDKAKLHTDAASAHKAAQKAHEIAGNPNTAEAHGVAVAKHEKIAANKQFVHDQHVKAANTLSDQAATASVNAHGSADKNESLSSQIAAHQVAADSHGQAHTAHTNVGNNVVAQDHLTHKTTHTAAVANLKEKQAAKHAATNENNKLKSKANSSYHNAYDMPEGTPEEMQAKADAFDAAAKNAGEALQHGGKHDLPHDDLLGAKLTQSQDTSKHLKAKADAKQASDKAFAVTDGISKATDQKSAHLDAAEAHAMAASTQNKLGNTGLAQKHKDYAKLHLADVKKINEEEIKKAKLNKDAFDASDKAKKASQDAEAAGTKEAHWKAHDAHQAAVEAGTAAGFSPDETQHHANQQDAHLGVIDKMQQAEEKAKGAAQDKAAQKSEAATKASDEIQGMPHGKALVVKHLDAASAHQAAAEAAKDADSGQLAKHHTAKAKEHTEAGKKLGQEISDANQKAGDFYNKGDDAQTIGDDADALGHFKTAAKHAATADNLPLKANALHMAAQISGSEEDHKAAAKAALKALAAENTKDSPSAFFQNKYEHLLDDHTNALDKLNEDKKAAAEAPKAAAEPTLKPVGKLKGTGKQLGSHANEVMVDEAGNQWLKKTDAKGYSRVLDPALASLQRKVGMETPVFVKTKEGHLQGMIPGAKDAFPKGQFDPEKLSPEDVTKMLQHQVLDFATGNQDTHSGQWLRNPDGSLTQIDQAQAFKFGVGKGTGGYGKGDPTTTYQPNHPDTPVYPKLWSAAEAGQVQIPDPSGDNDFAKTIQAIQDMPDAEFKALFKPYATQVIANGGQPGGHATVDGFLDDIVQHKSHIGSDFQKLYDNLPESAKVPGSSQPPSKEEALKEVAKQTANGTALKSGAIGKAKEAGATLDEIHKVMQAAKAAPPTGESAGLSEKDAALQEIKNTAASGKTVTDEQMKKAVDAGATPGDVFDIVMAEKEKAPVAPAASSPAGSPLTPKQQALKALAEHEHPNKDDDWTHEKSDALQTAAFNEGASEAEVAKVFSNAEGYLSSLPKAPASPAAVSEPAAPAAPAGPKIDPFKPQMKWSKTTHQVKVGDEMQDVASVAGPKGLHVHKATSGTGWSVTTDDGLNLGGKKFKTQKEAKLAAEWMAKNHGVTGKINLENHKEWAAAHPDEMTKLKTGIANNHWNSEAQAKLDEHNGVASAAAPAAPAGLTPKEAALKTLAEHNLPGNGDHWNYDTHADLTNAAKAAGATSDDIKSATYKPKTYISSLGDKGAAGPTSAPKVTFSGLSNDKAANAKLLKSLYDQAHSPNATAADKAEYAKAQDAWIKKHSSGPFDPQKYVAPSSHSYGSPSYGGSSYGSASPVDLPALTQKAYPTSHDAGFVMAQTGVSVNGDWKPTPAQAKGPKMYTSNAGYEGMNAQLRGAKIMGYDEHGNYVVTGTHPPKGYPDPDGSHWDAYIKSSDEAFAAVPPLDKDIVVGRKMQGYKPFDAYPPPMTAGAEYQDLGYGSTSKKTGTWSGDFHMEIQIPKGRKVLDLNHTTGSNYSNEEEILLNRGTTYRVISDTKVGNTRKVVVQVIDDGHLPDNGHLI